MLFHPKKICEAKPIVYCVCRKGERKTGKKDPRMTQCTQCFEWFHNDCARVPEVLPDGWECKWCVGGADKQGWQRWVSDRKKPKKRHHRDVPRLQGTVVGGDHRPVFSAPLDWEKVVDEVKEKARRAAVKNRQLTDAAQRFIDEGLPGSHHLLDRVGGNGLESRVVDNELIDDLIHEGLLHLEDEEGEDEEE